jgi:hypothetical protein
MGSRDSGRGWSFWLSPFATAVVFALVTAGAAGTASADQSYTDARGDSGPGTDITGVTVRNDTAGTISIQVGLASVLPDNHAIEVDFDADRNASTGHDGTDYFMYGGGFFTKYFAAWNGSAWVKQDPPEFTVTETGTVVEFRIHRASLGNTQGFRFAVFSLSVDQSSVGLEVKGWDAAGYYNYDLATAPAPQCSNGVDDDGDGKVDLGDPGCSSPSDASEADGSTPPPGTGKSLKIAKLVVDPRTPVAGQAFTMTAARVVRTGFSGSPAWSLFCEARIAGKEIKEYGSPEPPSPSCLWNIPASAIGKALVAKISISEGGVTTTETRRLRIAGATIRLRRAGRPGLSPRQPEADRAFYYLLPIFYQVGNAPVRRLPADFNRVSVQCAATIDGVPVRLLEKTIVRGSGPQCYWRLPPGVAGRTMKGTITVRYRGALLRHAFILTVAG